MSESSKSAIAARGRADHESLITIGFATALFASAFLLFSVQPLFAKMVLPKLGGAPAVWSVLLVCFQATLLAGYAYAHALSRWLPVTTGAVVHLCLFSVVALVLPFALPEAWASPSRDWPALWIIGLFMVCVGLPFFVVSANAPLLQAWFSRLGLRGSSDPYFLYAPSNVGSFLALLSYPVLVEPAFGLSTQALLWAVGFFLLTAMLAGAAVVILMRHTPDAVLRSANGLGTPSSAATWPETQGADTTWPRRLAWIALAAVPSGLLVAVTAHISTDIAAVPFLWVLPLGLFLLTFTIVFRTREWVSLKTLSRLSFVVFALWLVLTVTGAGFGGTWVLFFHLAMFVVLTMFCHAKLYRLRPAAERLTEFYMWMSFGGVVGGVVVSLVAPAVFSSVVEYPALIIAAMLCHFIGGSGSDGASTPQASRFAPSKLGAAIAVGVAGGFMAISLVGEGERQAVFQERSFFGVHRVSDTDDGFRQLSHGTTIHGTQRLVEVGGGRPVPRSYYGLNSPMGQVIAGRRDTSGLESVGVIGLGAGSLACHAMPGEAWTFFEIDETVVKIASDPTLFTFVSECTPDVAMVIGDARLTVADQPPGAFDVLLVDAFSSDAIPVHLLTREAIELFFEKVAADGVLTIHISNRHLELALPIAAIAEELGLTAAIGSDFRKDETSEAERIAGSEVVALSRDPKALAHLLEQDIWTELEADPAVSAWSDDYSDVFSAMLRKLADK